MRRVKRAVNFALLLVFLPLSLAQAEPKAETFRLANGLQGIVIPDHRVPVVTHMIWYRVGAADDPWGTSGIAHFLEHLMFKSTDKMRSGEFSRIITSIGGRDNAITALDTTNYFQRVSKQHLRRVMELEADRMQGLRLIEDEVMTEREVILSERRSTIDSDPTRLLGEQMFATLYQNHPYHRPVLGFGHEMAQLSRLGALAVYRRHYAPNNAVLVVAGDVSLEEVRSHAEATYGRTTPNPDIQERTRPKEPEPIAARRVKLEDRRTGASLVLRYYMTPSYRSAEPGIAESLELLARILGGDEASRLYNRLLLEQRLVALTGCQFVSEGLDGGHFVTVAAANPDIGVEKVEAAMNGVIAELVATGVTDEELERAKVTFEAERAFESDNQLTLARRYGEGAGVGRNIADIESVPKRIAAVTREDILRVAHTYLDIRRSVTGILVPLATAPVERAR